MVAQMNGRAERILLFLLCLAVIIALIWEFT
jgi:hypothetical protein